MTASQQRSAMAASAVEPCAGCGWAVEGGFAGCKSRFDEVIARDFSDARYFAVHRLLVDTYCLQHPDEYCASAKSLAAHLAGLCSIIEGEASAAAGPAALQKWLNGPRDLSRPQIPAHRGRTTIADLPLEADPGAWSEAVRAWAGETWSAYRALQPLAREWLAAATRAQ